MCLPETLFVLQQTFGSDTSHPEPFYDRQVRDNKHQVFPVLNNNSNIQR